MEERIQQQFHPCPPEAPIVILNQNQTQNVVPLCAICVSPAAGTDGVYLP